MRAVYQDNDAGAPCCAYINIMGENLQSRQEGVGEWALLISPWVHQQFSVAPRPTSGDSRLIVTRQSGARALSPDANALLP